MAEGWVPGSTGHGKRACECWPVCEDSTGRARGQEGVQAHHRFPAKSQWGHFRRVCGVRCSVRGTEPLPTFPGPSGCLSMIYSQARSQHLETLPLYVSQRPGPHWVASQFPVLPTSVPVCPRPAGPSLRTTHSAGPHLCGGRPLGQLLFPE